jgi:SAM-dependent methyltransferase
MSMKEYYEDSYQSERSRSIRDLLEEVTIYSKGLFEFALDAKNRFLNHREWSSLKVLETGAGRGGVGLHLARLGAQVTLVDFSPTALSQAEEIFALDGVVVKTAVGDVSHPDFNLNDCFDLIIDSHLLHCLTQDPDRASYYRFIGDHLTSQGIFVSETMVHRKNIHIPDGFMLDEQKVLWQMFGRWTPVRRILDSLDLEEELKRADLVINYFYYYGQFGFVPHRSFLDLPAEILPAAVRMVLKKK